MTHSDTPFGINRRTEEVTIQEVQSSTIRDILQGSLHSPYRTNIKKLYQETFSKESLSFSNIGQDTNITPSHTLKYNMSQSSRVITSFYKTLDKRSSSKISTNKIS